MSGYTQKIDQQRASLSPRMKPELTKRRSQMAQIAAQNVLTNCNIVIQEGTAITDTKHFLSIDKAD